MLRRIDLCRSRLLAGLLIVGCSFGTAAGALKVGDQAPRMQAGRWVQGDAVTDFERDKVYLVEFWATWCGPCKASIPHLNELHERFKDKGLVVIGQNVWENDEAQVDPFVRGMAGKMTYRVATDDKAGGGRGTMAEAWLAAAQQKGIPCAMVVTKQGTIGFIGHPMSLKPEALEAWLAEGAPPVGTSPRPADTASAPSAAAQALAQRAESEIRTRQWDKAEATVAELQEALSEKFRDIGGLLHLDLLLARKQAADALQLAKLMHEDFKDRPQVQLAVATRLAEDPAAAANQLTAAEKMAAPLAAKTGDAQPAALAVLARIHFLRGDKPRAIELQKKAVGFAGKNDAPRQQAVLDAYQQGHLPEGEVTAPR